METIDIEKQQSLVRTEKKFDPSILSAFLYQTLQLTEEVKNVLKLNCDEAMFSLKPWRTETMVKQELTENACICSEYESGVGEIAAGISRALLQTQQLREKLSLRITGKDNKKRLTVAEIYNSFRTENKKGGRERNSHESNKKSAVEKNLNARGMSPGKDLQMKTSKESSSVNKQLMMQAGKLTKNKNFLAINKQNIKNSQEIRKQKDADNELGNNCKSSSSITQAKCINFDKRSSMASTSELKDLIQKMSDESNNCMPFEADKTKCPLHGNVVSQITYEQTFVTVDVVDSLNAFNIPGEIVKSLKAYHAYLNNDDSKQLIDNGKQKKMLNKFLTEFDKMTQDVQKSLMQKNEVTTTLTKSISLLRNLFSGDLETTDLMSTRRMFSEINSSWKAHDVKELPSLYNWKLNKENILDNNYSTGWMSNGIWNPFRSRSFEGFSKAQRMYYGNNKQLSLFFETIQQLQQTRYSKELLEIILKYVLPNAKIYFDPTKPEFVKIYKSICIISQGLNPKVPVLVRTDK